VGSAYSTTLEKPAHFTASLNLDSKKPNIGIDLVRAVAIGVVLGLHFFGYTHAKVVAGSKIIRVIAGLFGHGYYGVTIFFVVSGFLIANSSFERTATDRLLVRPFPFYVRRATRILPLLWLSVLVGALALAVIPPAAPGFDMVFAQRGATFGATFWESILTFCFNWERIAVYGSSGNGGWGLQWDVLWSLAVEEQFYLIFPIMAALLGTVGRLRIAMGFIVAGAALWRAYLVTHGADWLTGFTGTLTCIDALALGVLAALMPPWKNKSSWLALGLGVLGLIAAYLAKFDMAYGLVTTGVAAATMLVIQATRSVKVKVLPPVKILARFGQLSYGLYLLHPMAFFLIFPLVLRLPPSVGFLLFLAASFALASISAAVFERPIERKLRSALLHR